MRVVLLTAAAAIQRFMSYGIYHLKYGYLRFVPLEHQCSMYFQDSPTFLETFTQKRLPVFRQLAVLAPHPRLDTCANKMRWIEYHMPKTPIIKRKMLEVRYDIGKNVQPTNLGVVLARPYDAVLNHAVVNE